ncbi:MAG: hypothetical protein ACI9C1_002150 [Candidatus Aldehydirespiratoraceae bacterium]
MKVLAALATLALIAAGCGDAAAPEATPVQAEAIANLIDAGLTDDEQRCVLTGLIDSAVEPETIIDGTVTGEEDAELLAVAVSCIEDLGSIPAFVQSFIEGAALEGAVLTQAEAACAIRGIGTEDQAAAMTACLGDAEPTPGDATASHLGYGDDPTLDLYWDACAAGNSQVCDDLYDAAPTGSEYLEFARTCGNELPDSVGFRCFDELG